MNKKREIIIDATDEKKIYQTIERAKVKFDKIQKGYIELVGDIAYLNEMQAYQLTGHKSIYSLCAEKFGMGRTMVYNLLQIYARFGKNYDLVEEAKELTLRQMLGQIKEEKKKLAEKNTASGSSEVSSGSSCEGSPEKKRTKHETILDFNFQNAIEWNGDELLDKLREEIDESLIIPEGAKIIITITT